jgi:hypothetical protein
LQWDVTTNTLSLVFTDTPATRFWSSSGRIVSVPDLEQSEMIVRFTNVTTPSFDDPAAQASVLDIRRHLRLSTIFLSYSGRRLMVRSKDMTEGADSTKLRRYSILLTSPAVERVN